MNNHTRKIYQMIQDKEIRAADVRHLNVFHDDWCSLLNRRGECNCDPVVELAAQIPVTGGRLNRDK